MHSSLLDSLMWFLSGPWMLLLLIPFVVFLLFKQYNRAQLIWVLSALVLTVVLTDQLSVHLFKEVFERYRPSHHSILKEQLHLHKYADGSFYSGGKFGFVSSHAANYFGILTLLFKLLNQKWMKIILFIVSIMVVYSRVYLGVHYVSDILCGAILGWCLAKIVLQFLFLRKLKLV